MKDTDWKILYELYMTPNITKVAEKLFMAREFDSCIIKTVLAGRIKPVLFLSNFLH